MTPHMMPNDFEEWREPGVRVFVTVDHQADRDSSNVDREIGVGDENDVAWMSLEEARWLRARLDEAILAAAGARQRRLKRVE